MDKLYIGDIPSDYHYALFNSNFVDLFNTSNLTNGTYQYYRVYLYDNFFAYDTGTRQFSQYNYTYATDIDVTDDIRFRRDFPDIAQTVFLYVLLFVFLVNLVTSSIKRNGLLGGLL